MADLHKYTTKEVLNKVLLDSSGNAVAAYSHTSQEALNAVLDSANSRLNVSLAGGTIDGDLTITGDFKVEGGGSFAFDEIIEGTQVIDVTNTEAFLVRKDSDGGDVFVVDTTNSRVGIGTSSPGDYNSITNKLVVANTSGNSGITIASNSSSYGALYFADGTSGSSEYMGAVEYDHTNNRLKIWANADTDQLVLDNSGRLGIGTSSPSKELTINGTTPTVRLTAGSYTSGVDLLMDTGGTAYLSNRNNGAFKFSTNNLIRATIGSGGNIGVGTESPSEKLTISGGNVLIDEGNFYKVTPSGYGISYASSQTLITGYNGIKVQGWISGLTDLFIVDTNSRISLSNNDSGGQNTIFGYEAGDSMELGGNNNTAFGYTALQSNTTADSNVAIGYRALRDNTTSTGNVAIGTTSLQNHVSGNGGNIAIGSGAMALGTGGKQRNHAIGYRSQYQNNTGAGNDSIGYLSLQNNVNGDYNVAIGYQAMQSASGNSHNNNVAIGYQSMFAITTGSNNVAVGLSAGSSITNNASNVIVGRGAFQTADDGENNNTIIGDYAGRYINNNNADHNVLIGNASGQGGTGELTKCVVIGSLAMDSTGANAQTGAIAIGYNSLTNLTSGQYNTAIGYESGYSNLVSDENTYIGAFAGYSQLGTTSYGGSTFIGYRAGYGTSDAGFQRSVVIGAYAGEFSANSRNTIIGYYSGRYAGTANVIMGYQAGIGASGSSYSNAVIIGYNAGLNNATKSDGVAIGYQATYTGGSGRGVYIGNSAGYSENGGTNYNVSIGHWAGYSNVSSANITYLGGFAGRYATGANNTYIGYQSGSGVSGSSTATNNVAVGKESLYSVTTGSNNTAVGYQAGYSSDSNGSNVFVGNLAGYEADSDNISAINNVYIGESAGRYLDDGTNNVAIGFGAMQSNSDGALNVTNSCIAIGRDALAGSTSSEGTIAIGHFAGDNGSNATNNSVIIGREAGRGALASATNGTVAIGYQSLTALTSGAKNTAIGSQAGSKMTTNSNSTYIGYRAGYYATGGQNTIVGTEALLGVDGSTTANENSIFGYYAGRDLTTGYGNCLMGRDAGQNLTTGWQNVIIGTDAGETATGLQNAILIGKNAGKAINSLVHGTIAIGTDALKAVTSGPRNVAIGYASGDTITNGEQNVLLGYGTDVSASAGSNQIVIGTNITGTANARVHIGNDTSHIYNDYNTNATWNHASDERQKKEIKDDTLGLEFINDIRPVTYKHKSPSEFPKEWNAYDENDKEPMGGDKVIHGLIAQEVKQALDKQGVDTFSGWDVNPDGRQNVSFEAFVLPLIKAVQELSAEVNQLKQQLKDK